MNWLGRLGAGKGHWRPREGPRRHPPSISSVFARTSARCSSVPGSLAIRPTITAISSGLRADSVQRPVQQLCGVAVSCLVWSLKGEGNPLPKLDVEGSSPFARFSSFAANTHGVSSTFLSYRRRRSTRHCDHAPAAGVEGVGIGLAAAALRQRLWRAEGFRSRRRRVHFGLSSSEIIPWPSQQSPPRSFRRT